MDGVKSENISKIDESTYLVQSSTVENIRYIANVDIAYCTSVTGKTGALCKHQCLLMHCLKIHLTNSPALNSIDRCNLAGVALREQRPPQSFFREFSLDTVTEAVCEKTESSSGYQIENISCNIIPNSKKENSQKEVSSKDGEEN